MTGVPDDLERLWTPHRMAYVTGGTAPVGGYDTPEGCPFCRAPGLPPEEGLVVARGELVYAVLNRFPYNPGHLLICPYRHVPDYTDLDEAETAEFSHFSQTAMTVIRRVSNPDGFNLGMNQGGVAGAGIATHLHQHILPRWSGDTNFMPLIARTKTVPQLLDDTRRLLADAWPQQPVRRRAPRRTRTAPAAPQDPTPATRTRARRSTVDVEADSSTVDGRTRTRPTRRRA